MKNRWTSLLFPLLALTIASAPAAETPKRAEVVRCRHGAVVSVSGQASEVGVEVLKADGNAVDAAVAVAFVLAVTHPEAGNIGGGGFMLVVPAGKDNVPTAFDFREAAPAAATKDMFVKPSDRTSYRHVGVPGTVRGLALAHQKLGKLPWKQLVLPAVRLAREGLAVDTALAHSLNEMFRTVPKETNKELHRVYGQPDGQPWQAGHRLFQPDLARTLQQIAVGGPDAFYTGTIAEQIVAEMKRGDGLISRDDLAAYRAKERTPLTGTYRGYDIYAMPPPSSGGTVLLEMLNMLETFDLRKLGRWSPETLHLLIETMKRGFRDRAAHLGDPDFVKIPGELTSKKYAEQLARGINLKKATPARDLAREIRLSGESEETTHFSVIDKDRLAVSVTYTLENSYGSRVVVKGAGFLLNDEMGDFNPVPGITNGKGRIGTSANLVAPGKRMLSSMSPTIVSRAGKPVLITGSPGGRTIINTVLCVVINVLDFDMDLRAAVEAPRLHHQWLPDKVHLEPQFQRDHKQAIERLRSMGHVLDRPTLQGDAHSIAVDAKTGEVIGVADWRIRGRAAGY